MDPFYEHCRDSEFQGDPRRCPVHPNVKTSSDDGMFDCPCGVCEMEMDDDVEPGSYERPSPVEPPCAPGEEDIPF